jgi:hypothetical protein
VTATRKTDKAGMRRDRWRAERVFEWIDGEFVPVDSTRVEMLEDGVRQHRTGATV